MVVAEPFESLVFDTFSSEVYHVRNQEVCLQVGNHDGRMQPFKVLR